MTDGICTAKDCGKPRRRKKSPYCATHYSRWRVTGRLDLKSVEERYEEKVDRSGGLDACHPWRAACNPAGYGLFVHDGETLAARWAYRRYVGPIPKRLHVCHSCDNPPCQNQAHWFLGTNLENQADKIAKNRQHRPRGERNVKAKLTAGQVAEIRNRATGRYGEQQTLGREYGVSQVTISAILQGRTWRSV